MVPLVALWLPIIVAAVIVFFASFVMHMLLKYHNGDYHQIPNEDKVLATLREAGVKPMLYVFPYGTHETMKSPEMQEKYKQGPVGTMTVRPSGPIAMGKFLGQWFVFCLIIGFFTAYVCAHTLPAGTILFAGVSRRRYRGLHVLRIGQSRQRYLEGPALGHDDKRSGRWAGVRIADGGDVWVAVAEVEE